MILDEPHTVGKDENYYTCAWSFDDDTSEPILAEHIVAVFFARCIPCLLGVYMCVAFSSGVGE